MAINKEVLWKKFPKFLLLFLALLVVFVWGGTHLHFSKAILLDLALLCLVYALIRLHLKWTFVGKQGILNNDPTAILIFNRGGHLAYLNRQAEKYLGFSLMDGRNKNYQEIVERFLGQAGVDMVNRQFLDVVNSGAATEPVEVMLNVDGKAFYLELAARPSDPDWPGQGITLTLRDVSFRREFEERLRRLETLSVVGQLAAGMAHEIRNPLTAVRGFGQLLYQRLEGKEKEYAGIMLKELDRASHILQDFLQLARPDRPKLTLCDLHLIMDEAVQLVAAQAYFKDIQINKEYGSGLPMLLLDGKQIKQVVLHLLGNAMAALEGGGNIYLRTSFNAMSREVIFQMEDTGAGMDEVTLSKMGQPFFTTKENGTGLGLCVSYQIIREHGGTVAVASNLGKGTTFTVILPNKE